MKNLLPLLFILLFVVSCNKEETECKCNLSVEAVNSDGSIGRYTITNIPTDCNGNFDLNELNLPDNHFIGSLSNCD